jgi:small subunit ribosomal protein S3
MISRSANYLKGKLQQAAISKIVIERAWNSVRVTLHTARPGLVIGRKGQEIETMTNPSPPSAGGKQVKIDIIEIKQPELDAQLVAENVAVQLERRISFRRAMKRALQTAMDFGADGIRLRVAGRLGGADIARAEWYREGKVPLANPACPARLRLRRSPHRLRPHRRQVLGQQEGRRRHPRRRRPSPDQSRQPRRRPRAPEPGPRRAPERNNPPPVIPQPTKHFPRRTRAMPLMPKRVKFRKTHRGSRAGNATRGTDRRYGDFGLQSLGRGWMAAARSKPAGSPSTATSNGKANSGSACSRTSRSPVARRKPGWVRARARSKAGWPSSSPAHALRTGRLHGNPAKEAMRLASNKLGIRCRFVKRHGTPDPSPQLPFSMAMKSQGTPRTEPTTNSSPPPRAAQEMRSTCASRQSTGQLENSARIRHVRREIARVLTASPRNPPEA